MPPYRYDCVKWVAGNMASGQHFAKYAFLCCPVHRPTCLTSDPADCPGKLFDLALHKDAKTTEAECSEKLHMWKITYLNVSLPGGSNWNKLFEVF